MSNAPIDLYYWPTPNGWKISIALEEMGLDYTTHFVNIGAGDQFKPDFLKIAPNNRMPAIVDPDGPDGAPVSIFESGAILQYLARKTGKFCGPTQRDRIAVDQWLMWQMGGLGPMAGQAHHFLKYAPAMDPPHDLPYAKDRYRAETGRLYGVLDRQLAEKRICGGRFLLDCRYGDLGLGVAVGRSGADARRQTPSGALARSGGGAGGGQKGSRARRGKPLEPPRRQEGAGAFVQAQIGARPTLRPRRSLPWNGARATPPAP